MVILLSTPIFFTRISGLEAGDDGLDDWLLPADPGLWPLLLTEKQRDDCVFKGPQHFQNKSRDYPNSKRIIGTQTRQLKNSAFVRKLNNGDDVHRDWLLYSPTKGRVFCFYCKLFSAKILKFASEGIDDWRHFYKEIKEHELSENHLQCTSTYLIRKTNKGRIDNELMAEIESKQLYWKKLLTRVVAVIKFLSERGLAFRGDNEVFDSPHNGNFLGLIELIAQFDPFLSEHISKYGNKGRGTVSYLSNTIVDELIALMGKQVLETIINEVKTTKYFSIIIDSTPDNSNIDQLSVIL